MSSHQEQWKQIQNAWDLKRIPQSLLFVGPLHCNLVEFTTRVMQLFLCANKDIQPCGACNDCHMVERLEHPDIEWIRPEKIGSAIKIDQIRELQNTAYLTPQRRPYRLVVIEAADRMNTASSNALLKILEEPAQHTVFILLAQQLSTVLPTILSRCQVHRFSSADNAYAHNLLLLGEHYPLESDRGAITQQCEVLLDGLIDIIRRKEHPCTLASKWIQFEISSLLWFLYLVFAQLQQMQFKPAGAIGRGEAQLQQLSSLLHPALIFSLLDTINSLLRKISHNINVNYTLALEDLLFALVTD